MPNKLTDNEIKKALECCSSGSYGCENGCPLDKECDSPIRGSEKIMESALDIINRQEARIHQQEKTIMEIQNANLIDFKATIGNYIAENESLKAEVERLNAELEGIKYGE